jgi:hypothetical protein
MSLLLEYFLRFMLLKLLFPDLPELGIFFQDSDSERVMHAGMHLMRDLMVRMAPQAVDSSLHTCFNFLRQAIRYSEYGAFKSEDEPTMCIWLRNRVLMMTQSQILLQSLLGGNYQIFRQRGHPVRKMFAVTIKHCFDMMLKPVITVPSQYFAQSVILQDPQSLEVETWLSRLSPERSPKWSAKLPQFESIYDSHVWHHQPYSRYISYPVFTTLKWLVFPFLTHNPQLQIDDNEQSLLILWSALNTLLMDEANNSMFGVSKNRLAADILRSASSETIMSIATSHDGTLLREAILWFSSEKKSRIKKELHDNARKIVLELSECAMRVVVQCVPQGASTEAPTPYD